MRPGTMPRLSRCQSGGYITKRTLPARLFIALKRDEIIKAGDSTILSAIIDLESYVRLSGRSELIEGPSHYTTF